NIRSGVFTVDAEGKLLYANPTAEHLLGINLIAHTGQAVLDVIGAVAPDLAHAVKRAAESKVRTIRGECVVCTEVRRFPVGLTTLVMRESDRLSRLLSEFLDFARVRVAKTEAVDLARIARDAASLAAAHPDRDSTVRVTCVIPEGDDVQIEGDEDLLHRAVFN